MAEREERFHPALWLDDPGLGEGAAVEGSAIGVLVRGSEVTVAIEGDGVTLPARDALSSMVGGEWISLGKLGSRPCFAAPLGEASRPAANATMALPPGIAVLPVRQLFDAMGVEPLAVIGSALALVEWTVMHRFCGRCAAETTRVVGQRVRRCPRCAASFHPRIAPATIVLVTRGAEMLLARNVHFPPGRFSAVAGFVETGESLEEAARREVLEEVGVEVEVGGLRYFGSQSWPFGRSLMIGFRGAYLRGNIQVDGVEIAEAAWFDRAHLPTLPPRISIARQLIDDFLATQGRPPAPPGTEQGKDPSP